MNASGSLQLILSSINYSLMNVDFHLFLITLHSYVKSIKKGKQMHGGNTVRKTIKMGDELHTITQLQAPLTLFILMSRGSINKLAPRKLS